MESIGEMFDAEEVRETLDSVCEDHGKYVATDISFFKGRTWWTRCPECEEIRIAEQEAEKEREQRGREKIAFERGVINSCIPERFKDRTLESYVSTSPLQKQYLDYCTHYAENFSEISKSGQSLIMIGKPGTGKTHLAVGIALHVMGQYKYSALFSTVQRAVRRVKETWSYDNKETESKAIEHFTSPHLLILDEVGIQFGSKTEEQILFDILNDRYERMKPTIIISNLSQDEVFEYLGERIADRMREDGGKVLAFNLESHRRQRG